VRRLAQRGYAAAAAVRIVGLDNSQPFAALKQQVNMRSDGRLQAVVRPIEAEIAILLQLR